MWRYYSYRCVSHLPLLTPTSLFLYDHKHLTYRVQIRHVQEELRKGVRYSNVVDWKQMKTT